jgi:adenylosuccinate synthase
MSANAVIGLGFGDEGKGVVTEYLCSQDPANTVVIRFSGGQQAAHTVCKDNVEHVFSQFGSGTLSGCPTYWSKYCTFDPVGFRNELELLLSKGIHPRFYIHPDCAVTTPYDVFANRKLDKDHGTCGTGFFRTKKRHFMDGLTYPIIDMFDFSRTTLRKISDYYGMEKIEEEDIFLCAFKEIYRYLIFTESIPDHYPTKVFEGSQGLMLDEHIGFMPHCSPSDITPRNAMMMAPLDEVWLVTRCYQTRHGNGPMTNGKYPPQLSNTEKETNVCNKYQGEFRTSMLDLDQLMHAKVEGIDNVIPASTRVNLVITCVDQVDSYIFSTRGMTDDFAGLDYFIQYIGSALKINGGLYVNTSPYSTTVKEITK